MSNFSTGTSSTAFCRDTRGPQTLVLPFPCPSGVRSIPSCPPRSHSINIYLSQVTTRDRYISVPCDADKYTGTQPTASPKCLSTVLTGPEISPLQFYSLITDANDKSSLVTPDHMKAGVSGCLVEGRSLMVPQAAPGELGTEGMVRGSYAPWDASWARRVTPSLDLQYAFQACRV